LEVSRAISSSVFGGSHDAIRRCDFARATEARVNMTSASDGSLDFGGIVSFFAVLVKTTKILKAEQACLHVPSNLRS
jgi:hypothetical protein